MDFIPLLKSKKSAIEDCQHTIELTEEKRQQIKQDLQLIKYGSWGTKGALVLGIVLGVDWKTKVSIMRREVPLAVGAILLSAISDYLVLEHVWGKHEK